MDGTAGVHRTVFGEETVDQWHFSLLWASNNGQTGWSTVHRSFSFSFS